MSGFGLRIISVKGLFPTVACRSSALLRIIAFRSTCLSSRCLRVLFARIFGFTGSPRLVLDGEPEMRRLSRSICTWRASANTCSRRLLSTSAPGPSSITCRAAGRSGQRRWPRFRSCHPGTRTHQDNGQSAHGSPANPPAGTAPDRIARSTSPTRGRLDFAAFYDGNARYALRGVALRPYKNIARNQSVAVCLFACRGPGFRPER